jgi:serine/threonine protein kinase
MLEKNDHVLGKGGFGQVTKRMWGELPDDVKKLHLYPSDMPVAVKKPFPNPEAEETIEDEIAIHRKLNHPHIVNFLARLGSGASYGYAMEFVSGGNLEEMLLSYQGQLPSVLQVSISYDISLGLEYLHNLEILHRDLKVANVLIETRNNVTIAKLCDFGLAVEIDKINHNENAGTPHFMAPELLPVRPPVPYSTKSDIYSLALIFWMLTAKYMPFRFAVTKVNIHRLVKLGIREEFPKDTLPDFQNLTTDCLEYTPRNRPQAQEVSQRLQQMLESVKQNIQPLAHQSIQFNSDKQTDLVCKLAKAVRKNNIIESKHLLDKGAEPNCLLRNDRFVLMNAAINGSYSMCKLLIENGADPLFRNKHNDTAENNWSTSSLKPNPFNDLRKELNYLASGDQRLPEERKEFLLDLVLSSNTKLLDWPLTGNPNRNGFLHRVFQFNQQKIIMRLTAHERWPVWSQMKSRFGYTLLHNMMSLEHGLLLIKYLSEININDVDNIDIASALHVAVNAKLIQNCLYLLEHGANPNLQAADDVSVLMLASEKGNIPICRLLLENGACQKLKDKGGVTAEEIWDKLHPDIDNPFMEYRKHQVLKIIESKVEKIEPISLYTRLALLELKKFITSAKIARSTKKPEEMFHEFLERTINSWKTDSVQYKYAWNMGMFQKYNHLEEVYLAIKLYINPEYCKTEPLIQDRKSEKPSSFLPAI